MLGRQDGEPLPEAEHAVLAAEARAERVGARGQRETERQADLDGLTGSEILEGDAEVDGGCPFGLDRLAVNGERLGHLEVAEGARYDGEVDVVDRA